MTGAHNRRLRLEAERAHSDGDLGKAVSRYSELEKLEPHDPNWPRRIAEICKEMGKKGRDEHIRALARAADKYANTGDVLKAIAMCKALLDVDPNHYQTQHRLAALYVERAHGASKRRSYSSDSTVQPWAQAVDISGPVAVVPSTSAPHAPATSGPHAPAMAVSGPHAPATSMPSISMPSMSMPSVSMPGVPAVARETTSPPAAQRETTAPPPSAIPGQPIGARETTQPPQAAVAHAAHAHAIPSQHTPNPTLGGAQLTPQPHVTAAQLAPAVNAIESLELHRALARQGATQEAFIRSTTGSIYEIPLGDAPQPVPLPRSDSRKRAILRAQTVLPFSPLFSSLSEASLVNLIQNVRLINLPRGQALFRQGDAGEAMYVVAEGSVAIIAEKVPRIELAKLGEGAFFGEIALLTNQARSATVEALVDTQLLEIDRITVNRLIQTEPGVLPSLLRFVSRRVLDLVFQTHPLFRETRPADRASLATKFRFLEVEPGTVLIHEGVVPLAIFVLIAGSICATSTQNPIGQRISGAGTIFGEDAGPARATIWAETKCLVLGLRRDTPAP